MKLRAFGRKVRINDEVYALSRMLDAANYEPVGDILEAALIYVNDHSDKEGYPYRAIVDHQCECEDMKLLPGARGSWHRGYVYYCIARGIRLAEKRSARG